MDKKPKFNLNHILQETGLKADTLRAWESRYGLPKPQRSDGGHRLFSEYDLAVIHWLLQKKSEGISVGRAADIFKNLTSQGKDPLQLKRDSGSLLAKPLPASGNSRLDEYRKGWIEASLVFDEAAADNLLTEAFLQYPVELVCENVLQKGLAEIGDLWYSGEANAQQEHFASELAVRRLQTLIAGAPRPVRSETIFVGCPQGETHTFPLLMITLLLRYRSWNVIYLGANIPNEQLKEAIHTIKPDMVVMGAMQLVTAASMKDAGRYLLSEGVLFGYGGNIFLQSPNLIDYFPGCYLGDTLLGTIESIEEAVIHMKPVLREPEGISWENLLKKIENQHSQLISDVNRNLGKRLNLAPADLNEMNSRMLQDVMAALRLGSINYLGINMQWLKGLLDYRNVPDHVFSVYITAWKESLNKRFGNEVQEITDWLDCINGDAGG